MGRDRAHASQHHPSFLQTHITTSRTASRRLPRSRRCKQDARGPSTILEEVLHVSLPVTPGLPARVHARLPCRHGCRYGRCSTGNCLATLVQAGLPLLADGLKSQASGSPAWASAEGCSCKGPSVPLRRVARAAHYANQALSVAPIPLRAILDHVPRTAGPRATFILQTMAAGASLCDFIADEIGNRAADAAPCHQCSRNPRVRE